MDSSPFLAIRHETHPSLRLLRFSQHDHAPRAKIQLQSHARNMHVLTKVNKGAETAGGMLEEPTMTLVLCLVAPRCTQNGVPRLRKLYPRSMVIVVGYCAPRSTQRMAPRSPSPLGATTSSHHTYPLWSLIRSRRAGRRVVYECGMLEGPEAGAGGGGEVAGEGA